MEVRFSPYNFCCMEENKEIIFSRVFLLQKKYIFLQNPSEYEKYLYNENKYIYIYYGNIKTLFLHLHILTIAKTTFHQKKKQILYLGYTKKNIFFLKTF